MKEFIKGKFIIIFEEKNKGWKIIKQIKREKQIKIIVNKSLLKKVLTNIQKTS